MGREAEDNVDPTVRPAGAARPVCLALGANVGDRLKNLQTALQRLATVGTLTAVSDLYETAPSGVTDQPPFLNAACVLLTDLSLRDLLGLAKRVEWELGRRPGPMWGPRPADIDLLLAESELVLEPDLIVPHPLLHERAFVLAPLMDIAPDVRHPLSGNTIAALWNALPAGNRLTVERVAGQGWWAMRDLPRAEAPMPERSP